MDEEKKMTRINKILFLILLAFIAIIIFSLWIIRKEKIKNENYKPLTKTEMYSDSSSDNLYNEVLFYETKKQLETNISKNVPKTLEMIFQYKILKINREKNQIAFNVLSLEENSYNKKTWYGFDTDLLDKITVFDQNNNELDPIKLTDLKENDIIDIFQKNNYSKENFSESVISIKIIRKK